MEVIENEKLSITKEQAEIYGLIFEDKLRLYTFHYYPTGSISVLGSNLEEATVTANRWIHAVDGEKFFESLYKVDVSTHFTISDGAKSWLNQVRP